MVRRTFSSESHRQAYWKKYLTIPKTVCIKDTQMFMEVGATFLLPTFKRILCVQPLTAQQVDDYLSQAGLSLEPLGDLLSKDADLQALAQSPYTLSLLILAYYSDGVEDLLLTPPEKRPGQVCLRYTQRVFQIFASEKLSIQKSIQGLKWFACLMKEQKLDHLSLGQVKREWLRDNELERSYQNAATRRVVLGSLFLVGFLFLVTVGLMILGLGFGWVPQTPGETPMPTATALQAGFFFLFCVFLLGWSMRRLLRRWTRSLLPGTSALADPDLLNSILWKRGYTPKKMYGDFLDTAEEHYLLYKDRNGYRFVHPFLLDYFASDTVQSDILSDTK